MMFCLKSKVEQNLKKYTLYIISNSNTDLRLKKITRNHKLEINDVSFDLTMLHLYNIKNIRNTNDGTN